MRQCKRYIIVIAALLLAACAAHPQFPPGSACTTGAFSVSDQFHGARRGTCTVVSDERVRLQILPEDEPPINDSPWFAFRIDPVVPGTVRITLDYDGGHHRYIPKLSFDGRNWLPLGEQRIRASRSGRRATLTIDVADRPVFVAAQELLTPAVYDAWIDSIMNSGNASAALLGHSLQGRPIHRLDANEASPDVLLIVGRQHPPEVSGAVAFMAFAETLFGDSVLATRFRERFRIIAVPLLNPDGVVAGHWRHNVGGVDLNRDWGPFTQPETQLIRDLLDSLEAEGARVRLFLDFHSTNRNVFYTQNDEFPTDPPNFMADWLQRADARIDDYDFDNDANPVSEQANSKNYMFKRYGIPTATYEVGDETDRAATRNAATIFAEELMIMLLEAGYSE